jgi:flagellar biosynthesis protein FlhF
MTTKTYRGRSLEELLPKVRAELGPDAVIVRQREGLTGGVGGFFQKRLVEIEAATPDEPEAATAGEPAAAAAGGGTLDVRDDTPATPDFLEQLAQAEAAVDATEFVPLDLAEPGADDAWSDWRDPAPAPALGPFLSPQVTELPEPQPVPEVAPEGERLPAPRARPAPPAPAAWPEEAATLRDALVARGVEAPLADEVVAETVTHLVPLRSEAKLRPLVVSALARRIPVAPLGGLAGRVVAFVGPGGAGKTHCTGRLAAAYAAGGRMPVACVAIAPRDGGAELALLLAPAGVPLHTAATGAEAAGRIAAVRDRALVLVDTPGVSPRAKGDLRALHGELRALGADDVLLALPATTSAGAARELVAAGRRIGASGVVLTHADETEHLGPAVGVAMEAEVPFAYVGDARALRPAAAEELAGALVGSSRAVSARR